MGGSAQDTRALRAAGGERGLWRRPPPPLARTVSMPIASRLLRKSSWGLPGSGLRITCGGARREGGGERGAGEAARQSARRDGGKSAGVLATPGGAGEGPEAQRCCSRRHKGTRSARERPLGALRAPGRGCGWPHVSARPCTWN